MEIETLARTPSAADWRYPAFNPPNQGTPHVQTRDNRDVGSTCFPAIQPNASKSAKFWTWTPDLIPSDQPMGATPMEEATPAALLTGDEVANLLRVNRRTLQRYTKSGLVPAPDLTIQRFPRWKKETILAWLRSQGEPGHFAPAEVDLNKS